MSPTAEGDRWNASRKRSRQLPARDLSLIGRADATICPLITTRIDLDRQPPSCLDSPRSLLELHRLFLVWS